MNEPTKQRWIRADLVYGLVLFALASAAIYWLRPLALFATPAAAPTWQLALFVVAILITISMGFPHPRAKDLSNVGHVSFDRVAQIASILVLGPIQAAVVNLIASFVYPWHRLRTGQPLRKVLMSALFNSGLMAICVLLSGAVYLALDGPVPLLGVSLGSALPLAAMIVSFEAVHEVAMQSMIFARRGDYRQHFDSFSLLINVGTALGGILVAVVLNGGDTGLLALLLLLLLMTMIGLKQLASIRMGLEEIVAKRTEQLKQTSDKLRHQANHDALTGLHNRRYINRYLEQQIESALFTDQPLSIAAVDIDHFKSVNDDFSHAVGDDVLCALASLLRENCRDDDCCSRYGGEEFLLVLPRADRLTASVEAERLRSLIERHPWQTVLANRAITVSIGVADLASTGSHKRILDQADKCLYLAKHQGRNQVVSEEL